MKRYTDEAVQAKVIPVEGEYLRTRYQLTEDGPTVITVGMGEDWTPLACKEVYGKAAKTALSLDSASCLLDLTAAARLGFPGLCAAMEGVWGGSYKLKFAMTDEIDPPMDCYACGEGWTQEELDNACQLARSIILARNLGNKPANCLTPRGLAQAAADMAEGLPLEVQIYERQELAELGLEAFLTVGDSSGRAPAMAVLRYNGAPDSPRRVGFVGKGVTCDTGGSNLKSSTAMVGMKGDMAGAAAVATAIRALAATGARVNATAVVLACENRLSRESALPGDVIGSLSGKTIEVLNTDAEGRLLLADGLTWAIRRENCTHLVDVATLTGAIVGMLGHVATGVMANDEDWYGCLEAASVRSGERFWRMPSFPEYEQLIDSDLADVRNTSKDGCGALTAGLFLRRFTEETPWLHLDIAGTADGSTPVWQHQAGGSNGAAVSTLYHLAVELEERA